jgi:AraC family transcriptional regulator, regulatory protein of adaptative response / methylated-DNA-[protein]-cysteine methyltransferase
MSSSTGPSKALATEAMGSDATRWQAVLSRDRRLDGTFVTAVLTTGIYCRPSCAARRPKRENVRFYDGADQAERAGFRPCLRCHPREAPHVDTRQELVRTVCRHLEQNPGERYSLAELGRVLGLSPHHLQRTFRQVTGVSPRQYSESLRLGRLKQGLRRKESVTMALYEAGYGSSSRLYERSSDRLGMTPGNYRAGGRGQEIRYSFVTTPIGSVLVAATERGVCSVRIGEPEAQALAGLKREFPAATIRPDRAGLLDWVRPLTRHLEGSPSLDLPLDIRATAFQWKVWEALRAIPYGETRTYCEVARAIGSPRAARAVGRACATNPVALVIPCHRVVREDGSLGGFGWGIKVKEKLLDSERRGAQRRGRRS